MTEVPASMAEELSAWNNGAGIDLESWVGCPGNFRLAVGYTKIFWPRFVEYGRYILTEGFTLESVKAFENQADSTPQSVEWVLNHRHIADLHYGCDDIAVDKIILLGNTLAEIDTAKLQWQFPDKPCEVEFYRPEDPDDLVGYQISFWQKKHSAVVSSE